MKIFGTDGVRGVANVDLTAEFALRLGTSAGRWLKKNGGKRIVIGRDPRLSGSMLGSAIASGFCSVGIDIVSIGISPTPGVSFIVRNNEFDLGIVISASHNPARDNGIKFFNNDGKKLDEEHEKAIEDILGSLSYYKFSESEVGVIEKNDELLNKYAKWVKSFCSDLSGLRIAVDCSNGAMSFLAPEVLQISGAEVLATHCKPDGLNINMKCGATHPENIKQFVLENKADIGVSFDGDGDRVVFCDEKGQLINGDRTMAICAVQDMKAGKLRPPVVIGTVMSNGGFENALRDYHIELKRAKVGDKHVYEMMQTTGAKIGGEQSGHIIFSDYAPTGDGLLTCAILLSILKQSNKKASELEPVFDNYPQVLYNLKIQDGVAWENDSQMLETIKTVEKNFNGAGRVNIRKSGTQPMLRLMVEADSEQKCEWACELLLKTVLERCSGQIYSKVELHKSLGE